ncbi:MAG: IMPACT family protein [Flavobacteriaceae bacterium]|nr:IMPACT family protein [Flavobacteriaceae bacterium]
MKDTYLTIASPVEDILFKDKGSKFLGFAYPVQNEKEALAVLCTLKDKHPKATHHCYAWQIGSVPNTQYRANDDGEPANTAGTPIYGQIQSFELTNIFIVVIRYYGGTKLGVRGLINAYKTTAKTTLGEAKIITKILKTILQIQFEYALMNKVQRIIKSQQLEIHQQELTQNCTYTLYVRQSELQKVKDQFASIFGVKIY